MNLALAIGEQTAIRQRVVILRRHDILRGHSIVFHRTGSVKRIPARDSQRRLFAFLFQSAAAISEILVGTGVLPIAVTCLVGAYFAVVRPERLQSEDYQLRSESLRILREKGGRLTLDRASLHDIVTNPPPQTPPRSLPKGEATMKRIFLLLFTPPRLGPESIFNFLDSKSQITDWHAAFPNAAFLVSDMDSDHLRDILREGLGSEWFIVTELKFNERGTSLSGWLPTASWDFLGRHCEENWPHKQKQPA